MDMVTPQQLREIAAAANRRKEEALDKDRARAAKRVNRYMRRVVRKMVRAAEDGKLGADIVLRDRAGFRESGLVHEAMAQRLEALGFEASVGEHWLSGDVVRVRWWDF